MADEKKESEEAAAAPKPSKLLPIILIVNLLGTGLIAFKVMTTETEIIVQAPTPALEEIPVEKAGPVHPMEAFLVNLNEPGGGRFLRTTLEVEVADDEALAAIVETERKIRDEILRYLSNLDVAGTMGEENRVKIQDALAERIDKLIGEKERVKKVYFVDFVVQ